ncbi:MAG: multicopper oxidase family protein, partial [Limisphaerales bacterium]
SMGTNHLAGGMGDMHSTNSTMTMDCTGMMTLMLGTNAMPGVMLDTNGMDQMHLTGTMTMTCSMGTNHLVGGMGDMHSTNSTMTMDCTGTMTLMSGTNAMPGDMMDTNSMIQMQMTGTMICTMGTSQMEGGTNSMGGMESTQGMEMEILRFDVDREGTGSPVVPAALATLTMHDPAQARRTRTFTLDMLGMAHGINGVMFDVNRVDFRVPSGELEIWAFRNTTDEIHPMHPHGALFQVLDRNGDTDLPPENRGWKDTVLVWPNETVRVLIRFEAYGGVFVSHCHNLEHEDSGMMQNFEVLPVRLTVGHQGEHLAFSFPGPATNYVLEVADRLGPGAQWIRLNDLPVAAGDQVQISIPKPSGDRFYRLLKLPEAPGSGTDPHAGHH